MGNGFWPLVREYGKHLKVNCCDFSPRAVNFVKEHECYREESINAQVCDLVNNDVPFEKKSADFGIFLFVLSAISPENFTSSAAKLFD